MRITVIKAEMPNIDVIGKNMKDPFMDSYQEEAFACCDILGKMDGNIGNYVNITFDKRFLRKIIRSHIFFIKDIEKGTPCRQK
jgi:hypothetical protein